MGHGKQKKIKKNKVWKILDGTYKRPIGKMDVERLIVAVQQECYWDDRDVEVWDEINAGKMDWSGERVRSKRKPRTYIRKRS